MFIFYKYIFNIIVYIFIILDYIYFNLELMFTIFKSFVFAIYENKQQSI